MGYINNMCDPENLDSLPSEEIKEKITKEQDFQEVNIQSSLLSRRNYPWKIECFLEDLFLGGQSSIILGL